MFELFLIISKILEVVSRVCMFELMVENKIRIISLISL